MENKLIVSICIPAYNELDLLKRCLNSVLEQSFKDYEIIVSDDSSDDQIKNYLSQLNLPNLSYFHNALALGSPLNWNSALKKARGKYVKILHHDDYFTSEESLGVFVNAMEKNPGVFFAFCHTRIYFKALDKYFLHKQTATQLKRLTRQPEFLFFRNIIGAPSVTFFRNDQDVLFSSDYRWLVDVDFYLKYFKKHPGFLAIPRPLVTVVQGEGQQITGQVIGDKKVIISENLKLFSMIYSEELRTNKALVFFQELFVQFDILHFEHLTNEFEVPENLNKFLSSVFDDLSKNKFVKALKKRLLTSRYNKLIFKIERF